MKIERLHRYHFPDNWGLCLVSEPCCPYTVEYIGIPRDSLIAVECPKCDGAGDGIITRQLGIKDDEKCPTCEGCKVFVIPATEPKGE